MFKILSKSILTIFLLSFFCITFGNSGETEIPLNSATETNLNNSGDNQTKDINQIISEKKDELTKIIEPTKQEKDITNLQNTLKDIQIKKDLNQEFLDSIKAQVLGIKQEISKNEDNLKTIKKDYQSSSELKIKLNDLEKQNKALKDELSLKEMLEKDLEKTEKLLNVSDEKYDNILEQYVSIKKKSDDSSQTEKDQKMNILYMVLVIAFAIYLIKIFLFKKFGEKYEKEFLYFDLIFTMFFIIFFISFFFYLYKELYILLFFISGYLIYINAPVIGSFMGSFIVFRKYAIGNIIKQGDDKGIIIKISPIYTTIKLINDDGIITDNSLNIPNIILVREKVDVIKDPKVLDHNFYIILNLKEIENIFNIVDYIEENIILKAITHRLNSIDSQDQDVFKITYENIEFDKLKIKFFWRATSHTNRQLEKKIMGYIKSQIDLIEEKKLEKEAKKEQEKV